MQDNYMKPSDTTHVIDAASFGRRREITVPLTEPPRGNISRPVLEDPLREIAQQLTRIADTLEFLANEVRKENQRGY